MKSAFEDIFTRSENEIFRIVFYPDRIYHSRYLNAARSSRYRYDVDEVRSGPDMTVLKGSVYMGGSRASGMLRMEYRSSRLVEAAREFNRRLPLTVRAWVRLLPEDESKTAQANVVLHWDPMVDAYQVELWETLEPAPGTSHDIRVLGLMGADRPITRIPGFGPALADLRGLRRVELAFREPDSTYPTDLPIPNPQSDDNYLRSYQKPVRSEPSSAENTVPVENYLIDFQRGFFIADAAQVEPVRYRNAMTDEDDPQRRDDNIIEMRWLFQREFGSDLVFFHEVTIPPGTTEGVHRHIGSEELYYVVSGQGLAYMRDGDDPATGSYPLVTARVYGIGTLACREIPVGPGSVIYTKSGGVHGIRNPSSEPLKFVAFLYQTS